MTRCLADKALLVFLDYCDFLLPPLTFLSHVFATATLKARRTRQLTLVRLAILDDVAGLVTTVAVAGAPNSDSPSLAAERHLAPPDQFLDQLFFLLGLHHLAHLNNVRVDLGQVLDCPRSPLEFAELVSFFDGLYGSILQRMRRD